MMSFMAEFFSEICLPSITALVVILICAQCIFVDSDTALRLGWHLAAFQLVDPLLPYAYDFAAVLLAIDYT